MIIDTKVIAHRGSKGTRPENTLPAFQAAIDNGTEGLELDVQLTKDRQLVVMHDEYVDRTTDGYGLIKDKTLAEMKLLDAGVKFATEFQNTQVPTLDEVLTLITENQFTGIVNIEFKTNKIAYEGIEEMVHNKLRLLAPEFPVIYSSFNGKSLKQLHELDSQLVLAKLFKSDVKSAKRLLKTGIITSCHPDVRWLKRHLIFATMHAANIRAWTVNTEEDMRYCFAKNFAAIMTDFPAKAIQIRSEMRGN